MEEERASTPTMDEVDDAADNVVKKEPPVVVVKTEPRSVEEVLAQATLALTRDSRDVPSPDELLPPMEEEEIGSPGTPLTAEADDEDEA